MEYVMVPVPEELTTQVDQYLRWNVGDLPPDFWPQDAIRGFVDSLDEQARTLLLHVAVAAEQVVPVSVRATAEATGCSVREALGIMMELNDAARGAGGPVFILATTLIDGATESGPDAWNFNTNGDLGRLFLDASRS